MNETMLEAMQARAQGAARSTNPYGDARRKRDWYAGYDMMDGHVRQVLENADNTLRALREMKTLSGNAAHANQDETSQYSTIVPAAGHHGRPRRRRRP